MMCCGNNSTQQQQLYSPNTGNQSGNLLQKLQVAQLSIFSFVFVLGIWGNVIVIVTIFTQKRLRSPSNYFIANLAVADLGGLCLSMPVVGLSSITGWPLGEMACRFIHPLQDLFLHVSMITLTVVAVDRYVHMVHPFSAQLSMYKVKLAIVLIWLVDYLMVPLPMALILKVITLPSGLKICFPMWSAQHKRITIVCLASLIFLSVFVTACAYLGVAVAMKQQQKRIVRRAQESGIQEKTYRRQLEKNAKTVKMMVVIVVVFWVSVLPLTLFGLLRELKQVTLTDIQVDVTYFVTSTLLFLQNCANPFILYVLSRDMRAGFVACAQCCPKGGRKGPTQSPHRATNGMAKMQSFSNNN